MNNAEHTINDAIRRFSSFLISANIGLAVKEGSGDFTGGTHVSASIGEWLQLGAYFNTHFAPQDSTIPESDREGRWLLGGQIRGAYANLQFDLLYAFHANASGKLELRSGQREFGGGISGLIESWKTVIGVGYVERTISATSDLDTRRQTVGVSVRRSDPNSPVLVVGWNWESQRVSPGSTETTATRNYPMAQLIYPLSPY
jgi:hypothetical protein